MAATYLGKIANEDFWSHRPSPYRIDFAKIGKNILSHFIGGSGRTLRKIIIFSSKIIKKMMMFLNRPCPAPKFFVRFS